MRSIVVGSILATAISGPGLCLPAGLSATSPLFRSIGHDDRQAYYYDSNSISRAGNIVTVTTVSIFNPDGGVRAGVFRNELEVKIDCVKRVATIVAAKEFDQEDRLIQSKRYAIQQWEPFEDGGAGPLLLAEVCTPGERLAPQVTDIRSEARLIFTVLQSKTPPHLRRLSRGSANALYVDAATITRTGDIVRAKVIIAFNRELGGPDSGAAFLETTEEFDCSSNKNTIVAYFEYGLSGERISEGVFTEAEWSDFPAGSISHEFKEAVCSPDVVPKLPTVQDLRSDSAEGFRLAR